MVQLSIWPWRNYGEVDRRMIRTLERAVATLGDREPDLLVRVLAGLAVERYYAGDPDACDEPSSRAVELARDVGDPTLLALALDLRFVALWRPDRMPYLATIADEMVHLARAQLPEPTLFVATFLRLVARLTLGDVEGARGDEAACTEIAGRLRQPSLLVMFAAHRAMRAGLDGDADEARRRTDEGLALYRRTQVWPVRAANVMLLGPIAVEHGGVEELAGTLLGARVAAASPLRLFACTMLAEAEHVEPLDRELAGRGPLPDPAFDWSWLANTCGLASIACVRGDAHAARTLLDALAPHAGQIAMYGSDGCLGAVDEFRGRCLALLGEPEADACWRAAAELHDRLGAPHLHARTLLHHARFLAARGDTDRARGLLDDAAARARRAPALLARVGAARAALG